MIFSPGIEEQIRNVVRALNAYNLSHWNSRIAGVHLDVEPHARADYKASRSKKVDDLVHSLFSRYTGLLKCFRSHIDLSLGLSEQDFTFSAATGWWYESRPDANIST